MPGAALGVERVIGSRYSVGLQTFLVGLTTGWGVYANYNIISRRGKWIAGIDWIVYSNTNELTFYTEDSNGQNYALLSVGYEFE